MTGIHRTGARVMLILAVVAAQGRGPRAQSGGRLEPAEKPRLVDCQPSMIQPAFRARFNLVDADGAPLSVDLGSQPLKERLTIFIDERPVTPFFASARGSETQKRRERIALVLVDISGSMNSRLASGGTRFDAAKTALATFVGNFEENTDKIAIVPFESHEVLARIRAATFATTKAQALAQIQALPAPRPRNNTAIYSSVVAGAAMLSDRVKQATGRAAPEALLVIMTDGKNEVRPGDDPGLLDGPSGVARAAEAVSASGVQVIAIGFGDRGSVDEAALTKISTQSFMAADSEKLKQVFALAHTLLTDRITATFASPSEDRASLVHPLKIHAVMKGAGNQQFVSRDDTWSPPQMGVPTFDDKCDPDEVSAALDTQPKGPIDWLAILRPFLVFIGIGTLLLILWFWVPRLVWPEQYIGSVPTATRGRWASATGVIRPSTDGVRGRQPPAGFQRGKGGAQAPRAADDRTVVSPDADLTRTRLQRAGERDPRRQDR